MLSVELYVDDVGETAAFFSSCLGFRAERLEPTFASLWLAGSRLVLNAIDGGEFRAPNPILKDGARAHRGAGLELVVSVEDVDELYGRVSGSGYASFVTDITDQYWGLRDFRFLTPDGFYVRVTEFDDEVPEALATWTRGRAASP